MTKVCIDREECFIAVVFEGIPGKFFDSEPELWGSRLFSKWGATMGAIHSLSRSYDVGVQKHSPIESRYYSGFFVLSVQVLVLSPGQELVPIAN
ncbi:hypothetical protein M1D70_15225 [Paenibacillus sp. AK002]